MLLGKIIEGHSAATAHRPGSLGPKARMMAGPCKSLAKLGGRCKCDRIVGHQLYLPIRLHKPFLGGWPILRI
jgi:hypothetical protein